MTISCLAPLGLIGHGHIILGLCAVVPALGAPAEWLIDDFSRPDGRSALGPEWRFFADTVMGGVSRGRATRDSIDGRFCLRLTGQVSVENNGGFVQVALPLDGSMSSLDGSRSSLDGTMSSLDGTMGSLDRAMGSPEGPGGPLNAGAWKGIRLLVRGGGEDYDLHLRTGDTRRPWQYYRATFSTTGEWARVDLPFDAFEPASLREPLDPTRLTRIGIVAARRAFQADVAVASLSFYR